MEQKSVFLSDFQLKIPSDSKIILQFIFQNDIILKVKRLRRLWLATSQSSRSDKGGDKVSDYIMLFISLLIVLEILKEIKK